MPTTLALPADARIDIHTHILPETWPNLAKRYGYGGFVELVHLRPGCARMVIDGQSFREIHENCWNPQIRRQECAASNVQVQVLSTVPVMFSYWARAADGLDLARMLNDHLAQVVRSDPQHFLGLGTVPLQDPNSAIREMERCRTELGLLGVEIGTHVNAWNLGDPELFDFFAAAESLDCAVFVHPWDMLGKERMPKYWLPWLVGMPTETALAAASILFSGTLEKLPHLRIAFAHGGGALPAIWGRLGQGHLVRPDLCAVDCSCPPDEFRSRLFFDTLVHDADVLRLLIRLFGAGQLAFGSDYPFPLGESHPGELIDSMPDLAAEAKHSLFQGTALRWLGLE